MIKINNSLYFFLLALLGIMPTIISSYILYLLYSNSHFLENPSAAITITFFCITSFTMALAITPTTFIAIISGYFFSWTGLIGISISYIFASVFGLLIGRGLQKFGIAYTPKAGSKFEKLLTNFGDREFMLIAFARLSPILPFAMTNVALSSINLRWKNYLLGSLAGMFPRTFIFFWAGKNAADIWTFVSNPTLGGVYKLLPVALILVSTVGLYLIIKKKLQQKTE